jgi:hypoxanthine phosphoribosyltransferase
MTNFKKKILYSEDQIQERVGKLAEQISEDYAGKTLHVICLVNSASFFCVDLVRNISIPMRLHFFAFDGHLSGNPIGEVRITLDITETLYDQHVLVVEGIVVSGRSPKYVMEALRLRKPASLAMCVLGMKPEKLIEDLALKYVAFELGTEIAVGYGIGSGLEKTSPDLLEM